MIARLDAYYMLIHPHFPILPPSTPRLHDEPSTPPTQDSTLVRKESPLFHAIAAFVALIPCKTSHDAVASQSRTIRHRYAEYCCGLALASVDRDMDALEPLTRTRFHYAVPVRFEGMVSTFLVAVFEYSYRGAMMRARTRMASVITMALDLGLQDAPPGTGGDLEYKRGVWSMIVSDMRKHQVSRDSDRSPAFLCKQAVHHSSFGKIV